MEPPSGIPDAGGCFDDEDRGRDFNNMESFELSTSDDPHNKDLRRECALACEKFSYAAVRFRQVRHVHGPLTILSNVLEFRENNEEMFPLCYTHSDS